MAGMLPGVELARKRRIHHRGGGGLEPLASRRGPSLAGPSPRALRSPTSMAETTLLARRRLEEKLRVFGLGSAAAPSPTAVSYAPPRAIGEPRGPPPRRGAPAKGGATAGSTVYSTNAKKPPPPTSAALERMDSAASECAVCLDGFRAGEGRQVLNLPCSHRYHWHCVLPWLAAHPHCPCCRTPVPS